LLTPPSITFLRSTLATSATSPQDRRRSVICLASWVDTWPHGVQPIRTSFGHSEAKGSGHETARTSCGPLRVLGHSRRSTRRGCSGRTFFTTGGEPRVFGGPTISGQINRVKVDGIELTVLIADTQEASGAVRPHGIAVDVVWGKIYIHELETLSGSPFR